LGNTSAKKKKKGGGGRGTTNWEIEEKKHGYLKECLEGPGRGVRGITADRKKAKKELIPKGGKTWLIKRKKETKEHAPGE